MYYVFVCLCMSAYTCHVSVGAIRGKYQVSGLLELELQAVLRYLPWVIGTEIRSPGRTPWTLNCWSNSPAPGLIFLIKEVCLIYFVFVYRQIFRSELTILGSFLLAVFGLLLTNSICFTGNFSLCRGFRTSVFVQSFLRNLCALSRHICLLAGVSDTRSHFYFPLIEWDQTLTLGLHGCHFQLYIWCE